MGIIFYAGRTAVRSAARAGNRPQGQKPPEWQPFTKLAVIGVFFIGVPVVIFGWVPVAITYGVVIVLSLLLGIAVRENKKAARNSKTAPKESPEDRLLADLFGEQSQHKQGSKR